MITIIGEALIDLVPTTVPGEYSARAGGGPFNVAVGLARLGNRTALMARLADDSFGRRLRAGAAGEGIELDAAPHARERTTLAVVSVDAAAQATYDFYFEGTADWQWTATELEALPTDTAILHFGSIASWTAPGGERIDDLVARARAAGDVLVSYDPNVRPLVMDAHARERVARSVQRAHLVKASREDVEWLYPGEELDAVAGRWLGLGPALVVLTDGPGGATAYRTGAAPLRRPVRPVEVVDTIGAGDAFTSGLLSGLVSRGLHAPGAAISDAALAQILDEALEIAAITCERVGADPPRVQDLQHR